MDISIIIPVYNNLKFTKDCVDSIIISENRSSYEIIISDDNSTDDTSGYVENLILKYSNVKYCKSSINRGFAYTCNRGSEIADGEYILFLNNDSLIRGIYEKTVFFVFDSFSFCRFCQNRSWFFRRSSRADAKQHRLFDATEFRNFYSYSSKINVFH